MNKEYHNNQVYDFLIEECKLKPNLWKEFGEGLMSHTTDVEFWENLNEELDCFRVCEECGKPMIEGYVIDGCDTYCSDDCLHKHITNEEFELLYNNGNGDTYWTTWYEESMTYQNSEDCNHEE
jgi:hypothetical protein